MFLSLFAEYLTERTNRHIIEAEFGFATYTYTDNQTVYIEDLYVIPEQRKSGLASKLTNDIIDLAKAKGCTRLLGSVVPSSKTSTDSMKAFLAFGMKLDSSTNDFVVLSKEI
jgi:predicted GNAT family acetyltransferase